jgi:glucan phosphoethanolaminetransferase (alkaline phosphatase superfamily)
MKLLSNKTRLLLSILIIISFFLPAYNAISAFKFISLALSETTPPTDINLIDVLMILAPLVLIPIIAIVVFIRSYMKASTPTTVTGLPLLFLMFFFGILFFTGNISSISSPAYKFLLKMQIGFYLTVIASLLLLFTRNGRQHRHKRRRQSSLKATAIAA